MALALDLILRLLRDPECPRVLNTPELAMWMAASNIDVAEATFKRWVSRMRKDGLLKTVRRGLYLNALAQPPVQPDEAAAYINQGAIVSLQKVLGDAGVLNNFTSRITCVLPLPPEKTAAGHASFGYAQPSTGEVKTLAGVYTFQALPFDLIHKAGSLEDRLEQLPYQRATPEKAFLDWLYLGATPRSHMTPPPFDIDLSMLNLPRMQRLAEGMGLTRSFKQWLTDKAAYDQAPGTRANAPLTDSANTLE